MCETSLGGGCDGSVRVTGSGESMCLIDIFGEGFHWFRFSE